MDENIFEKLESVIYNSTTKTYYIDQIFYRDYVENGSLENKQLWEKWKTKLNIDKIEENITKKYDQLEKNDKLWIFLLFRKVDYSLQKWSKRSMQFLDPLFKRIDASFIFYQKQ